MSLSRHCPNFLRDALRQIRRDRGLTSATVLVMTLTVFVAALFVAISLTANSVLGYLEGRPQVTIFFKSDFAEEKVQLVAQELRQRSDVSLVNFVSKEDAYKFYLGQHSNDQNLLESVSSDIFPPALEVKSQKIENLSAIAEAMGQSEGVDEIVFFKDIIQTFKTWVDTARAIGLTLITVLLTISLFIILVTIGMTIRSRSEEIEIIKLLGATDWYIRLPFFTQGAVYGFLAGLFSAVGLISLTLLFGDRLRLVLQGISLPPLLTTVLLVSTAQIVLSVFFGVFGAWLSTKRYLRV